MIRLARAEDVERIGTLWLDMVNYHRTLDPHLFRASRSGAKMYAQRIEQRLADPRTRVLVVEIDHDIVAYALGMIADITTDVFEPLRSGLLADIYVTPDYRRRGWGRRMVQRLMLWFRSLDVQHFEWHVSAGNSGAISFWRSIGGTTTMLRMRAEVAGDDK